MAALDTSVLAERIMTLERHLNRVAQLLPQNPQELLPLTEASDGVILHLWQAVQLVIDTALGACVDLRLGTPSTYAESFRRLADGGVLTQELAASLGKAAGFRNLIVHAYDKLDMTRIHEAARLGPNTLRDFFAALVKHVRE